MSFLSDQRIGSASEASCTSPWRWPNPPPPVAMIGPNRSRGSGLRRAGLLRAGLSVSVLNCGPHRDDSSALPKFESRPSAFLRRTPTLSRCQWPCIVRANLATDVVLAAMLHDIPYITAFYFTG
jgi:hypothetical protein